MESSTNTNKRSVSAKSSPEVKEGKPSPEVKEGSIRRKVCAELSMASSIDEQLAILRKGILGMQKKIRTETLRDAEAVN